jgi:hypothetical protein
MDERGHHQTHITQRCQVDESGTMLEPLGDAFNGAKGEASLAYPARAGERERADLPLQQPPFDRKELLLSADQRRGLACGYAARGGADPRRRRIVGSVTGSPGGPHLLQHGFVQSQGLAKPPRAYGGTGESCRARG